MRGFRVGERVKHQVFGVGTVLRFENAMVGVDFGDGRLRWFEHGSTRGGIPTRSRKLAPPPKLPENVIDLSEYRRKKAS